MAADPIVTLTLNPALDVSTSLTPTGEPGGWAEVDDGIQADSTETTVVETLVTGQQPNLFYRIREL